MPKESNDKIANEKENEIVMMSERIVKGPMLYTWDGSLLDERSCGAVICSARQPALTSVLLALVSEVSQSDENCAQQQRATAERTSTRPAVREDGATDRAADQKSERATEHVEAETGSNRAHISCHGCDARALQGDEGTGEESVEQSPDHKSSIR